MDYRMPPVTDWIVASIADEMERRLDMEVGGCEVCDPEDWKPKEESRAPPGAAWGMTEAQSL